MYLFVQSVVVSIEAVCVSLCRQVELSYLLAKRFIRTQTYTHRETETKVAVVDAAVAPFVSV